ncbi:MAG: YciI family protein [Bacteroidota bacterium]
MKKITTTILGLLLLVLTAYGQSAPQTEQTPKPKQTANKQSKFIYVLKLTPTYQNEANWTDETRKIVTAHFNQLKKLKEDGQVILAGKTDYTKDNPANFGIVIFNAENLEAAKKLMNSDPAVMQNIMTAELHPFSLALLINE